MLNEQLDTFSLSIFTLKENNFDFGLQDYPIFDESYREILNNAILNYYLLHEIAWQNPMIFKHYLNTRMDLIMRNKYNELYKAKAIQFNPLYNVEMHETFTRTVNNTNNIENNSELTASNTGTSSDSTTSSSETNSDNDASALSLSSQYPSEQMIDGNWEDGVYISAGQRQTNKTTNVENTDDNSTTESETNSTTTSNGKTTIENNGIESETYSKDTVGSSAGLPFSRAMIQLKEYLDEFQLDQQVISELSDLFYNLY